MAIDLEDDVGEGRHATLYVDPQVDRAAIERGLFAAAAAQREAQGADPLALFGQLLLPQAARAQAQLFQDVFALFFNESKRGGVFVEVGTGDGKLISNTYLLEKDHDWTGLVVEANPAFLPALREHRACAIATDCVLDVTGREVRFQCLADPEFSGIAFNEIGLDGDEDIHALKRTGGSQELALTTISLNDLLAREGLTPPLDFLSVDVEGAEFPILRTLDFERWRPRCLAVEHNWHRSRVDVNELLQLNGYVRVFEEMSQWDDWFVDRAYLEQRPEWTVFLAKQGEVAPGEEARTLLEEALEAIRRDALIVAESLCRAALEREPRLSAIHRTLADVAQRKGHPSQAAQHWRDAIAVDPAEYWARIGLAELVGVRGETEEAVRLLNEAIALAGVAGEANAIASAEALLARLTL